MTFKKIMETTLQKGQRKELLAEYWLKEKGLTLVSRNYRSKHGEIDLIMQHGNICVFVEVRYRKSRAYGTPSETVDHRKQQKLIRTAHYFLLQEPKLANAPCRFDVVAITGAEVEWITNAFGEA